MISPNLNRVLVLLCEERKRKKADENEESIKSISDFDIKNQEARLSYPEKKAFRKINGIENPGSLKDVESWKIKGPRTKQKESEAFAIHRDKKAKYDKWMKDRLK